MGDAVRRGLVMEGGAMRGLFTAGVTDVLMEAGVAFDGAVGVSAGATFGCNYKSHQIGRALRYNKRFCSDWRYGSFRSLLHSGDMFDVEFCYNEIPCNLDVFDTDAFTASPMEFWCVATDVLTGGPVYHRCVDGGPLDLQWIRASASIPIASRIVEVGGRHCVDGGVSDPIPLAFLEGRGYGRNVVILTQPPGFVKEPYTLMPLFRVALRSHPHLIATLGDRHVHYNEQTAYVARREGEGAAFVIRPPEALSIKASETDPNELQRVYDIGRREGEERLPGLQAFLAR